MITQNVFPVRLLHQPSRRQEKVHANASARYEARRQADWAAAHDLTGFLLNLTLEPSGRRAELRDTPSPFA